MSNTFSYKPRKKTRSYLPLAFAVVLSAGMFIGWFINKRYVNNSHINRFTDVLNYIDAKYVDTINPEEVIDKAINNTLTELDPHSSYIPSRLFDKATESLTGNFEGIGIEFFIMDDTITVVTPISGGPSEKLGIQVGDKIVKINDTLVAGIGISNFQVVNKLRGKKGSKVNVSIKRVGTPSLIPYTIKRDKVPLHSIDAAYMINDTLGYVRMNNFGEHTHQEFVRKTKELVAKGMQKLLIDLRQNPGGYLTAVVRIADELIGGNEIIVYTKGKAQKRKNYITRNKGIFEKGEVFILVDENSASASEILAGAIQDLDRGKVIGRRTFGKGLVQEQIRMDDGSALRLSVAKYYTPSGRYIQKPYDKGITSYNNDLVNRYNKGEFTHQDTGLYRQVDGVFYLNKKEANLLENGGIYPDVFVPVDTNFDIAYYNRVRSVLPSFVYNYYANNKWFFDRYKSIEHFDKRFKVPNILMAELARKMKTKKMPIDSRRFAKVYPEIKTLFKAYVAKQIWKDEGFYYILNKADPTFLQAVKYAKGKSIK